MDSAKNTDQTMPKSFWDRGIRLVIPFFLLPLIIVSLSVGLFLLFSKISTRQKTVSQYVEQLSSSSKHKKWQAAFELSRLLVKDPMSIESLQLEDTLISHYQHARPDEIDFKRYLIMVLANTGTHKSAKVFLDDLQSLVAFENEIYLIWSMGRLRFEQAKDTLLQKLSSSDAGLRKTAAYSLGMIKDLSVMPELENHLSDPDLDVAYNSALALSQMGNTKGEALILQLLDLEKFKSQSPKLRDAEREEMTISALIAVNNLKLTKAKDLVASLGSHSNERLRESAQKTLQLLENNP